MSLGGRALKRSPHQVINPSLLSEGEGNEANPGNETIDPDGGNSGMRLEDLARVRPGAINRQAPTYDDGDLFDNSPALEVGQWPAAEISPEVQELPDELIQAAAVPTTPPEQTDAPETMIAPDRPSPGLRSKSWLRGLAGIAAICVALTGGIIFIVRFFAAAPSPHLEMRTRSESAPPAESVSATRPDSSPADSPTPKAAVIPGAGAPNDLSATRAGSERPVRTSRAKPARHVAKGPARPVRAKPRARSSAPPAKANVVHKATSGDIDPSPGAKSANSGIAFYNEGARLQKKGAIDAAISAYVMAIERNPSLIEAHNNLGVLRMHSGDPGGAEQSLQAAIALNSRYGPAYANLGRLYIQQRRTEQAEAMLLRAASLMPSNASVRNNLALLYQLLGRDEDEARAWRSALALGSNDPAVHYNLAVHYQRLGENMLARTHYEKALATENRLSPVYREAARRALESLKGG